MALWQRRVPPGSQGDDATPTSSPDDPTGTGGESAAESSLEAGPETGPENSPETTAELHEPALGGLALAERENDTDADAPYGEPRPHRRFADSTPVTLFLASHPRQAVVMAAGLALAAALSGRAVREIAVVAAATLVGSAVLGWHNDIVDAERDARHRTAHKPIAEGRLDVGTAWFAVVVGLLLLIPLALSTGVTAGLYLVVSVVVGIVSNVALRMGIFSWLLWAVSFGLLPFYLSYGGWGGDAKDAPPQVAMVALAALLGVGVHLLRALWGLVADDADGWTYYPLALGRRLGSTRLLVIAVSWCVVVVAAMGVVGATVGLRQ